MHRVLPAILLLLGLVLRTLPAFEAPALAAPVPAGSDVHGSAEAQLHTALPSAFAAILPGEIRPSLPTDRAGASGGFHLPALDGEAAVPPPVWMATRVRAGEAARRTPAVPLYQAHRALRR